jgi:4-hydroxy-4-methyl-2-oxoglutarate aldolase
MVTRSDTWLTILRRLPTPSLSDALDRLGLMGAMHGVGPLSSNLPRMVGYARTVWQGPRPPQAEPSRGYARHVELVDDDLNPDDVLVIGITGGQPASSWGALLTQRSRARGAAGVIIDGPVRDPAEIASLAFPVFRQPTFCPAGSKMRLATLGVDVPIVCAGVQVEPGVIVVGDDSGVVIIPPSRIDDVIAAAQQIVEAERILAERLAIGGTFR